MSKKNPKIPPGFAQTGGLVPEALWNNFVERATEQFGYVTKRALAGALYAFLKADEDTVRAWMNGVRDDYFKPIREQPSETEEGEESRAKELEDSLGKALKDRRNASKPAVARHDKPPAGSREAASG